MAEEPGPGRLSAFGPSSLGWDGTSVRKFARMMTSHNGYVLEQLFSPNCAPRLLDTRATADGYSAGGSGTRWCPTTQDSRARDPPDND